MFEAVGAPMAAAWEEGAGGIAAFGELLVYLGLLRIGTGLFDWLAIGMS